MIPARIAELLAMTQDDCDHGEDWDQYLVADLCREILRLRESLRLGIEAQEQQLRAIGYDPTPGGAFERFLLLARAALGEEGK